MDRRIFVGAVAATTVAGPAFTASSTAFPKGFLWGAATAGHQVEGNNVNSDEWVIETVRPTIFTEPSGDADNSLELWAADLDLVQRLGLNTYRFSLEWPRIEPEEGMWSIAMLDHYKRIIDGCRARRLHPFVTFNHYTTPRWFAAQGGWTNPKSPDLFARFCERAARHLGADIGHATTLNEPNVLRLLRVVLPRPAWEGQRPMLAAAARATGSAKFVPGNVILLEDVDTMTRNLVAGHKAGRAAIKSVRPDLPVGVSLAMFDDEAVGAGSVRDARRREMYDPWLEVVQGDDFLGVQNYERVRWGSEGKLPTPPDARRNYEGAWVYPPSIANVARYAHQATGVPIVVTEHGVGTDDDSLRAWLIPNALAELRKAMADGVPIHGYVHWSLLDNFEWVGGYRPKFGLCAIDRTTFARTPKPSAHLYGAIARRNAV